MTVVAMRMSVDRPDMPEPDEPMLRGLVPATSVEVAATGVEAEPRSDDTVDAGSIVAVIAGPHE